MAFCDNLKMLREKSGMSQPELAEAVGVAQSTISDFERGKKLPAIDTAVRIGEILHTTCEDMVKGKVEKVS